MITNPKTVRSQMPKWPQVRCHWSVSTGYSHPAATHHMLWRNIVHTCKIHKGKALFITILSKMHRWVWELRHLFSVFFFLITPVYIFWTVSRFTPIFCYILHNCYFKNCTYIYFRITNETYSIYLPLFRDFQFMLC